MVGSSEIIGPYTGRFESMVWTHLWTSKDMGFGIRSSPVHSCPGSALGL